MAALRRAIVRSRWRQRRPTHLREADATAFQQRTLLHQPRDAAALQPVLGRLGRPPDLLEAAVEPVDPVLDAFEPLGDGAQPAGG